MVRMASESIERKKRYRIDLAFVNLSEDDSPLPAIEAQIAITAKHSQQTKQNKSLSLAEVAELLLINYPPRDSRSSSVDTRNGNEQKSGIKSTGGLMLPLMSEGAEIVGTHSWPEAVATLRQSAASTPSATIPSGDTSTSSILQHGLPATHHKGPNHVHEAATQAEPPSLSSTERPARLSAQALSSSTSIIKPRSPREDTISIPATHPRPPAPAMARVNKGTGSTTATSSTKKVQPPNSSQCQTQRGLKRKVPRPSDEYQQQNVDWDEHLRTEGTAEGKESSIKSKKATTDRPTKRIQKSASKVKSSSPGKRVQKSKPRPRAPEVPCTTIASTRSRRAQLAKSSKYVEESDSDVISEVELEEEQDRQQLALATGGGVSKKPSGTDHQGGAGAQRLEREESNGNSKVSQIQVRDSQHKVDDPMDETVGPARLEIGDFPYLKEQYEKMQVSVRTAREPERVSGPETEVSANIVSNHVEPDLQDGEDGEDGEDGDDDESHSKGYTKETQAIPVEDTAEDSYPKEGAHGDDGQCESSTSFGTKLSQLARASFGNAGSFIGLVNSAKKNTTAVSQCLQQSSKKSPNTYGKKARKSDGDSIFMLPQPAKNEWQSFSRAHNNIDAVAASKAPQITGHLADNALDNTTAKEQNSTHRISPPVRQYPTRSSLTIATHIPKTSAPLQEARSPSKEQSRHSTPYQNHLNLSGPAGAFIAAADDTFENDGHFVSQEDVFSTADQERTTEVLAAPSTASYRTVNDAPLVISIKGQSSPKKVTKGQNVSGPVAIEPRQGTEPTGDEPSRTSGGTRTSGQGLASLHRDSLLVTDERASRKPQLIQWTPKGPQNQGSPIRSTLAESSLKHDAPPPETHKHNQSKRVDMASRPTGNDVHLRAEVEIPEPDSPADVDEDDGPFVQGEGAFQEARSSSSPQVDLGRNASQLSRVDENGSPRLHSQKKSRLPSVSAKFTITQTAPADEAEIQSALDEESESEESESEDESEYGEPDALEISAMSDESVASPPVVKAKTLATGLAPPKDLPPNPKASSLAQYPSQQVKSRQPAPKTLKASPALTLQHSTRYSIGLTEQLSRVHPQAPTTINTSPFRARLSPLRPSPSKMVTLSQAQMPPPSLPRNAPYDYKQASFPSRLEQEKYTQPVDISIESNKVCSPTQLAGTRRLSRPVPASEVQARSSTPASFHTQLVTRVDYIHGISDEMEERDTKDKRRSKANSEGTTLVADGDSQSHLAGHPHPKPRRSPSRSSSIEMSSSPIVVSRHREVDIAAYRDPWDDQLRRTQKTARDTIMAIADNVLFRLCQEEEAIESKVRSYRDGGYSVIEKLAAQWENTAEKHLRMTRQQLASLHRNVGVCVSAVEKSLEMMNAVSSPSQFDQVIQHRKRTMIAKLNEHIEEQREMAMVLDYEEEEDEEKE